MNCAAPAVPAGPQERYPTFFDLTLSRPDYEALARAYGSELPWETVRTQDQQQEGSALGDD